MAAAIEVYNLKDFSYVNQLHGKFLSVQIGDRKPSGKTPMSGNNMLPHLMDAK